MKTRLFILLLVQVLCVPAFSGNITKKYKSYLTEEGTVYFIMPQKMSKAKGSEAHKDLLFDVTGLSTSDSLYIAATIAADQPLTDSLVSVTTAGLPRLSLPVSYIYRDLTKKGYVNRVRIGITRSEFRSLFKADTPFQLDFGQNCLFAFRQGQWADRKQLFNSILDLIELNK